MGTRRPWVAGSIALVALILVSALASAGTRWGTAFTTTGTRKMIDPSIVRAFAPGGTGPATGAGARELAAPAPNGGCVPASCIGLSLVGNGSVTGLGNATGGVIQMTVTAEPIVVCTNRGGNVAPGANQIPIVLTGQDPFNPNEVIARSGKLVFQAETPTDAIGVPLSGPATQYGCPNDSWTASIGQYHFVNARMCAFQNDKQNVLQEIGCSQTYVF
jgi:hypothetical protein